MPSALSCHSTWLFSAPAQSSVSGMQTGEIIFTLAQGESFFLRKQYDTIPALFPQPNLNQMWKGAMLLGIRDVWRIWTCNPYSWEKPCSKWSTWFPLFPHLRVGVEGYLAWDHVAWIGAAHTSQGCQDWATAWEAASRLKRKTPWGIRAVILMVILNCFCLSNIPF